MGHYFVQRICTENISGVQESLLGWGPSAEGCPVGYKPLAADVLARDLPGRGDALPRELEAQHA